MTNFKPVVWEGEEYAMQSGGYTEPVPGQGELFIYYYHSPKLVTVVGLSSTPTEHSLPLVDGEIVNTLAMKLSSDQQKVYGIYKNPITERYSAMNLHIVSDFSALVDTENMPEGLTLPVAVDLKLNLVLSHIDKITKPEDLLTQLSNDLKNGVINDQEFLPNLTGNHLKITYQNIFRIVHDFTMTAHVLPGLDWMDI